MLTGDLTKWLDKFRSLDESLDLAILNTWPLCLSNLIAISNTIEHEDTITNQLVAALIFSKKVKARISLQHALLIFDENGVARLSSKIDFALILGRDEDVYLACECKRLNVAENGGTRSLAGEYVDEGIMRFITTQYASRMPSAVMLGYVMDSKIDSANKALKKAFDKRKSKLAPGNYTKPTSEVLRSRFASEHDTRTGRITVKHTLLAWPAKKGK